MAESEWNDCSDVTAMLEFLRFKGVASDRKLRLFAVACCRHALRQVQVDRNYSHAVDVAERFADGAATAAELSAPFPGCQNTSRAQRTASIACLNATEIGDSTLMADCTAGNAAWAIKENAANAITTHNDLLNVAYAAEQRAQASILRDIFGPAAFRRQVRIEHSDNLFALAKFIYDERAFTAERMTTLAEALRNAGHGNGEAALHCLQADCAHFRGCWVVDQILGKA